MALPDPIPTLTVDSVAYDFVRTGMGEGNSLYLSDSGLDRLTISHQNKARNRSIVRFDRDKVAEDPFTADINQKYSFSAYAVFDTPALGVTPTEAHVLGQLLSSFLVAGTPDYGLRVLKGEI